MESKKETVHKPLLILFAWRRYPHLRFEAPSRGLSQLLYWRRIEVEDSRRVESKNVSFGLLRQKWQVDDFARQVEVEMRPIRSKQQLSVGLDHIERALKRLAIGRLHGLRRVPAVIAHIFRR